MNPLEKHLNVSPPSPDFLSFAIQPLWTSEECCHRNNRRLSRTGNKHFPLDPLQPLLGWKSSPHFHISLTRTHVRIGLGGLLWKRLVSANLWLFTRKLEQGAPDILSTLYFYSWGVKMTRQGNDPTKKSLTFWQCSHSFLPRNHCLQTIRKTPSASRVGSSPLEST